MDNDYNRLAKILNVLQLFNINQNFLFSLTLCGLYKYIFNEAMQ